MSIDRQRMISAARRLLASRADAEDAVQDTYLRALSAFADRRDPAPAWFHHVLRNVAIDRWRRRQRERAHALAVGPEPDWGAASPEIHAECRGALHHLLSRVSPPEAAALLLRDVFEFDYDEIGRLCGRSSAAARQFVHRARGRTRRPDATEEADDAAVALCARAIERREPALLMHLAKTTTAQASPAPAALVSGHGARSASMLVQVNGRYALALVLDGVVLCVVPVGAEARSVDEVA